MTSQHPEDDPRADLPAEGRRQGLFSQLGGTRLCCSICSPSWCPRIAAIKLGSSFFPLGCWAPPHQQQNPQQCKNSLTPNEKGPHFLLKPLTDRLHSLQTYNNTKQKQQTQPPNITQLQKNRCSGTGARCLLPSTKSNSSESLQGAPTPLLPALNPGYGQGSAPACSLPTRRRVTGSLLATSINLTATGKAAGSTLLPQRTREPRSAFYGRPLPDTAGEGRSCTAAHYYCSGKSGSSVC